MINSYGLSPHQYEILEMIQRAVFENDAKSLKLIPQQIQDVAKLADIEYALHGASETAKQLDSFLAEEIKKFYE